jgi:hypothetical protein
MDKPPQILLLNFEQIVALSKMQETIDALLKENQILKEELEAQKSE